MSIFPHMIAHVSVCAVSEEILKLMRGDSRLAEYYTWRITNVQVISVFIMCVEYISSLPEKLLQKGSGSYYAVHEGTRF